MVHNIYEAALNGLVGQWIQQIHGTLEGSIGEVDAPKETSALGDKRR